MIKVFKDSDELETINPSENTRFVFAQEAFRQTICVARFIGEDFVEPVVAEMSFGTISYGLIKKYDKNL